MVVNLIFCRRQKVFMNFSKSAASSSKRQSQLNVPVQVSAAPLAGGEVNVTKPCVPSV